MAHRIRADVVGRVNDDLSASAGAWASTMASTAVLGTAKTTTSPKAIALASEAIATLAVLLTRDQS